MNLTFKLGLAWAIFIIPGAANAAEPEGDNVRFRYQSEELGNVQNAQELHSKLQAYSLRKCQRVGNAALSRRKQDECTAELLQQFVERIDNPTLTMVADLERADARTRLASSER